MIRYPLTAFSSGLLFGLGLLLSGMANPAKVQSFLDLAGNWDPSLALVMAGAIGIGFAVFSIAKTRSVSLLGSPMRLPESNRIDSPLILGSLGFGIGWGLVGFCPGPALVALGAGEARALVFVVAMVAGMGLFEWQKHLEHKREHKHHKRQKHKHPH
ncbi:YeeE/YedE family protein [Parahaliea maris]|uniref:YeeE/YedE family protein n=1 Tax=Parahaliea maris TaxID=2716870 RepID=A0A5C8ZRE6_9GAMM|nr:YeeE/YedE family protein [Parahaliea maris]TXS90230.1 YeeE/YedE family protein [Parahaliea maris]